MKTKIAYGAALLLGAAMIFLGARFFFSPEAATAGYGIHFDARGDYSFDYIKGIRDLFSGLVLCSLALMKERRALGVALLAGTMIPLIDMLIVLSKPYNGPLQAMPHIIATIVCLTFGLILLTTKPQTA